ncbi:MAG: hypothetical protein ACI87W_000367 [Halieaceae bacterium]
MLRIALVFLGFLLALTLLAGVLLTRGMSLGFATPLIESRASALLGRAVTLGEPTTIELGNQLKISASQVSIGNADWGQAPYLLSLESLQLSIDIRSLLSKTIIVDAMLLSGLHLALEKDTEGQSNIPVLESGETDEEGDEETIEPVLPLVLRQAQLTAIRITELDPRREVPIDLYLETLSLREGAEQRLQLLGSGTLQERPWVLRLNSSSLQSLVSGENISADFSAELDDLSMRGDLQIPLLRQLRDLSLNARIDGSVPPRLAALSPLLDAGGPMQIVLDVSDVDPGLRLDLDLALTGLSLNVQGDIARPASSDGLDLKFKVDAASLPRLVAALDLGSTADIPLEVSGSMHRSGRHIRIQDLNITAGEHRILGSADFPLFPGTEEASMDLRATGPEFAFYQRLLERPAGLTSPYDIRARISAVTPSTERLEASLEIGDHRMELKGNLGTYPTFADSDLSLTARGSSLADLGESLEMDLPAQAYQLQGTLRVGADKHIQIPALELRVLGVTATASAQINGYPELDELKLEVALRTPSLARLSEHLDLQPLGDVPASLVLGAEGSVQALTVNALSLDAGGLQLSRVSGELRYADNTLSSTLRLTAQIEQLATLLGSYGNPEIPAGRFSFELSPHLSSELFSVSLANLKGPGLSGDATLRMAPDFSIDERTTLTTDLRFDNLELLLPNTGAYLPPSGPLTLKAETQRSGAGARQIDALIGSDGRTLLTAQLSIPSDKNAAKRIQLSGSGDDLRMLGSLENRIDQPLAYSVDAVALFDKGSVRVTIDTLQLSDSLLTGTLLVADEGRTISADLNIPRADLDNWLLAESPETNQAQSTEAAPASSDGRLIPDTALPLELLSDYRTDIRLSTGPLGIKDPFFESGSLIDKLSLSLKSGDGSAQLKVDELTGSRGQTSVNLAGTRIGDVADLSLEMDIKGTPVNFAVETRDPKSLPQHDIKVELDARGATLRDLAASLNGEVLSVGSSGVIENMGGGVALDSFLVQLVGAVFPTVRRNEDVAVECVVLGARAEQGVIYLDPGFIFRSKRLDLSARGELNLGNERLRVRFDNQAREGLGISASSLVNPYVQITGTLAKPSIGLDLKGSALAGGAAAATGGLTVIAKPLFGRFLSFRDPCKAALKKWDERQPLHEPST